MNVQCPKISVIMATYNDAKYIEECISSILSQSFTDFEFIIVDDASTDDSPNILANFAAKDKRIRILTNTENKERCISRNRAIDAAQAPYIIVVDADDWIYPERLAKQYAFMEQHPEVSICGAQIEPYELVLWFLRSTNWIKRPCTHEQIWLSFFNSCALHHVTIIIRKEHILKYTQGYQVGLLNTEDYDLYARLMEHEDIVFANMPDILVRYRFHPFKNRNKYKDIQQSGFVKIWSSLRKRFGVPESLLKISIITIVYNGATYLEECINSILNQSCMDFEYIIVDDASTDGTKSILAELAEKDKRIRILTNTEHKGYFSSLSMAIQASKSSYIAIMDANTIAHPERLALQYDSMQADKKISICGTQLAAYKSEGLSENKQSMQNEQYVTQGNKTAFTSKPATNYSQFFKHVIWYNTFMISKDYAIQHLKKDDASCALGKDCNLYTSIIKDNDVIFANRPEILIQYSTQQNQDSASYYEIQPNTKNLTTQHLQQHLSKIHYLKMLLPPITMAIANILQKILPASFYAHLKFIYTKAKKILF